MQAGKDQLRLLANRLGEVEEGEKKRICQELQDRVGQNLTVLRINLSILSSRLLPPEYTDDLSERLNDLQKLLEQIIEVIRDVMTELRPAVLDDYGLLAALRWFGESFFKRTGISVKVAGDEIVSGACNDFS